MRRIASLSAVAAIGSLLTGKTIVNVSAEEIVKRSRDDQPFLVTQPGQAPFKHRVEEHIRRKAFEKALDNSRKALEREERARLALRK